MINENTNKVAIVTGGSRGIGLEIAKGLALDGFSIAIIARSQETLDEALKQVQSQSTTSRSNHTAYALDVSDFQEVHNTVDKIHKHYGRIDLLVNCAGMYIAGTLNVTVQEFEQGLRVNLLGPFAFMQAVLPIMKSQKTGYIMNIASRGGKIGFAGDGAYGAGKFGLVGLSESLYRELADDNIKLTTLCPSWTNTDMAQEAKTPFSDSDMIQPSDILETIRWLLRLAPSTCIREIIIECKKAIH